MPAVPRTPEWIVVPGRFRREFVDRLASFRFTGDVHVMPEGTAFFPEEPILRVTAPLPEAQLVESRLINLLQFQTLIASKAARCVLAAPGKTPYSLSHDPSLSGRPRGFRLPIREMRLSAGGVRLRPGGGHRDDAGPPARTGRPQPGRQQRRSNRGVALTLRARARRWKIARGRGTVSLPRPVRRP